jgi:hypothetical protein
MGPTTQTELPPTVRLITKSSTSSRSARHGLEHRDERVRAIVLTPISHG